MSFSTGSLNGNALSVKGKVHCFATLDRKKKNIAKDKTSNAFPFLSSPSKDKSKIIRSKRIYEISNNLCKVFVRTAVLLTESEIREYYEEALKKEPQMLINELIKMIMLYDDRMKIELNSPIMKGPDESQGFSFYTEKLLIPTYYNPTPIITQLTIELAV